MKTARCLLVTLMLTLMGCSTVPDFSRPQPVLDLEAFFVGRTQAWGLVEDRFGNLRRQFEVQIDGRMEDGLLVLDEQFRFSDGETSRRVWRIEKVADGRYRGRADDVLGEAEGVVNGNQLRWRYRLKLDVGTELEVNFDDFIWQQSARVLINRATFSKWGLRLGTVTLFFLKEVDDA